MMKSTHTKKLIKFVVSVLVFIVSFFVFGICTSAKTYNSIQIDVPRISQRPDTGDCAIASMATIEAYMHGLPAGDYNSAAYQAVYSANNYSTSASWATLGYQPIESVNLDTLYSQLETGYPVIVYRSSSHYSVVYGYDGSTSALQMSGFKIVDVDDSYNSTTAYKRLDAWQGRYSLTRTVVRLDGLAIPSNGIKFACNHPAANHIKNTGFTARGMVISNQNLTNVTISVKTSAGKTALTYSATPNATSYAVSKANSSLNFKDLAAGSYVYTITASDRSGASKTYTYKFNVSSESSVPVVDPSPTVTKVSYTAVVTADPSLNLRINPGIDAAVLTTIPKGEKISVTAESSNGWAMVSYNGYVGWVSKTYIEKYTDPVITPTPNPPLLENQRYARVTVATNIKSTSFIFSSNVISVPRNAIVRITGIENGWLKVAYGGKTGYLSLNVCIPDVFDVDFNSKINSTDALLVLEAATGKRKLDDAEKKVADTDGNDLINSADALNILQVSIGAKTF